MILRGKATSKNINITQQIRAVFDLLTALERAVDIDKSEHIFRVFFLSHRVCLSGYMFPEQGGPMYRRPPPGALGLLPPPGPLHPRGLPPLPPHPADMAGESLPSV